jgi:hypothetical protein
MPSKTPGKLNSPPVQNEFDQLPLGKWCGPAQGVYYRLHSLDRSTNNPWPPIYFSQAGRTRFDPPAGPGTLYVGETLPMAYGPPVLLRDHPELMLSLAELEVAILP